MYRKLRTWFIEDDGWFYALVWVCVFVIVGLWWFVW